MVLHIYIYSLAGIWQTLLSQQFPFFIYCLYTIKRNRVSYILFTLYKETGFWNIMIAKQSKLSWFSIFKCTPWQEYGKLYCLRSFLASYKLFTPWKETEFWNINIAKQSKLPWFSIFKSTPWQEYGKLYCLSSFPALLISLYWTTNLELKYIVCKTQASKQSKLLWFSIFKCTPWQEYGKLYCLSNFSAS